MFWTRPAQTMLVKCIEIISPARQHAGATRTRRIFVVLIVTLSPIGSKSYFNYSSYLLSKTNRIALKLVRFVGVVRE